MKQQIAQAVTFLLWMSMCVAGCSQEETDSLIPGLGDKSATGDPVAFSISLQGNTEYNAVSNKDANAPDTRSERALIGEWVKVNSFSATRSADEYEGPAMAAMDLTEDGPATSAPGTRAVMPAGYYFRVIAFMKVGSTYVYSSAADYTANGTNAPVLKKGNMNLRTGQTYRFAAYSFNSKDTIAALVNPITWDGIPISIQKATHDFMTFVSEDKTPTTTALELPVSFTHQLCRLTVNISVSEFADNTFTNCRGVYVVQGGNELSWSVDTGSITANQDKSKPFNIPNNKSAFTNLVPFTTKRPITMCFGSITVGGKLVKNIEISSSQEVQLLPGKSYTMTVQFTRKTGIKVPEELINLGGENCTASDKTELAKLTWALGNLISDGIKGGKSTMCTSEQAYGHYYVWNSAYTGDKTSTSTDPCKELSATSYGVGWVTPTSETLRRLGRCTTKKVTNKGMWFMNNSVGLFLPCASQRNVADGSGTTVEGGSGISGFYWSNEEYNGYLAFGLSIQNGFAFVNGTGSYKEAGSSVRCVK